MAINIKNISLTLFSFLLFGCVTESLDIEIPQLDPKPVVFSQVIPNQIMIVGLSKTFSALAFSENEGDSLSSDMLDQLLEDSATVTISYLNQVDTLFRVEKGLYASLRTPQHINEEYSLNIITKGGEIVSAKSKMLEQANFNTIEPKIEKNADDTSATIAVSFNDLSGDNWYMVNFYKKEPNGGGLDINSIFNTGENNLVKTVLISDQTIDGSYTDTLDLFNFDIGVTDTIAVTLSNISKDYFNFLSLRKRSGNVFTEVTNEPINYPTNVQNGYGFFNTHYPDTKIFDLNKY